MMTDHSPDLVRQFFLEENPNPERIGCPIEETLRAAAQNRLLVSDPARLHMANCSECFAEYRGYRLDWKSKQAAKRSFARSAVAAAVLIGVVGGSMAFRDHLGRNKISQQSSINTSSHGSKVPEDNSKAVVTAPKSEDAHRLTPPAPGPSPKSSAESPLIGSSPIKMQPTEAASPSPVSKTYSSASVVLDVRSNRIRGGPSGKLKKTFALPASNLKLKLILPSTAKRGIYTLRLTRDLDGQNVIASAEGEASLVDDVLSLNVKMLLVGKAAGPYHLFVAPKSDGELKIFDVRIVADGPSSTIR